MDGRSERIAERALPVLRSGQKHFLCATNNAPHLDSMPGNRSTCLPSDPLPAAALLLGFLRVSERSHKWGAGTCGGHRSALAIWL